MGYSLYVQRAGGEAEHLSPVDLEQALQVFGAFPWKEDVAAWLAVEDAARQELYRPVLTLLDDAARVLQLTAYAEDVVAFAYEYPYQGSDFGFSLSDKQARLGTDQFPRSEVPKLFAAFLRGDQEAVFAFLEKYPLKNPEKQCFDAAGSMLRDAERPRLE